MELRTHWFELGYGISSVIYVVFMAYTFVVSYRIMLEVPLKSLFPGAFTSTLPWLIAFIIVVSAGVTIIGEMKVFQYRPR